MQTTGLALFVALTLLGCGNAPAEPATPTGAGAGAGSGGGLGGNAGHGGDEDPFGGEWTTGIFSSELDGSGVRALWKGDEALAALEVAPGGDKIAMVSFPQGAIGDDFHHGAIAVLDLTQADPRPEVVFDAEGVDALPSWSPDGRRLVFVSQCAGYGHGSQCLTEAGGDEHLRSDLYLLDPLSGDVEPLTTTENQTEGDPHWASADVILFTRVSSGNVGPEVWAHNLDSGNEKQITSPPSAPEPAEPPWGLGDFDPHLSPEGTLIAFERRMDASWTSGGVPIGDYDVLVLDLADGGAIRVPDDTHDADIRPVWAPGGWLAFFRGFEEHGTDTTDVMVMKQDGSLEMNITADLPVANEMWPHWIPSSTEPEVDGAADLVFMAHPYAPPCELLCALAAECGKSGPDDEGCLAWCQDAYGDMVGSFEGCATCATDPGHSCDEIFPDDETEPGICHQACQP